MTMQLAQDVAFALMVGLFPVGVVAAIIVFEAIHNAIKGRRN